jgi:hypothetical protein
MKQVSFGVPFLHKAPGPVSQWTGYSETGTSGRTTSEVSDSVKRRYQNPTLETVLSNQLRIVIAKNKALSLCGQNYSLEGPDSEMLISLR